MKIIILGAGQVGSNLTEQLCQDNDVTVIDLDAELLHNLQDRFDIKTVCGHAGYPTVLVQAGIEDADLLIALTSSDEANMIACQVDLIGMRRRPAVERRPRKPRREGDAVVAESGRCGRHPDDAHDGEPDGDEGHDDAQAGRDAGEVERQPGAAGDHVVAEHPLGQIHRPAVEPRVAATMNPKT